MLWSPICGLWYINKRDVTDKCVAESHDWLTVAKCAKEASVVHIILDRVSSGGVVLHSNEREFLSQR